MSAISETIDRILGRNGHERIPTPYWDGEEEKMSDPIFSELLSIIDAQDTISDSELSDIHTLVLDDQVCRLIFEDSHPESEMNTKDPYKDIGMLDITAIFHRFRPPEEAIIAKKDSPEPYSRLFCMWMCTYEYQEGTNYDVLIELLFDDIAGVGNQVVQQFGNVVSDPQIIYKAIKDYLDPEVKVPRNPQTMEWLFWVLNEIKDCAYNNWPDGEKPPEEADFEGIGWSLHDTDLHIMGGEMWARAIVMLQEDKDWLARVKQKFDTTSSNPYKCISETCNNHFWIENFIYSRRCNSYNCPGHYCDECLNDERICKTCADEEDTGEE